MFKQIQQMEEYGVEGVVMGKALYSGAIQLPEAIRVAKGEMV